MARTIRPKILVIDDEPRWLSVLTTILDEAGFQSSGALNGKDGIRRVYADRPDLILLDIMMPGMNGFEVLEHVRLATEVPVLMLTAATQPGHAVQSYNKGALDFVPKATPKEVMLANIRSKLHLIPTRHQPRAIYPIDDQLTIDIIKRTVRLHDQAVELTPLEWRVLQCLVEQEGQVVSCEELLRAGWEEDHLRDLRGVKVIISQLRKKLHDNPRHPHYIHTIREMGYTLDVRQPLS